MRDVGDQCIVILLYIHVDRYELRKMLCCIIFRRLTRCHMHFCVVIQFICHVSCIFSTVCSYGLCIRFQAMLLLLVSDTDHKFDIAVCDVPIVNNTDY